MAKISHKTGVEGPRHDPYSFDEWVLEHGGLTYKVHSGLNVWIAINTRRVTFTASRWAAENGEIDLDAVMQGIGSPLTYTQIMRAYRKMKQADMRVHRGHGGMQWSPGFPARRYCFASVAPLSILNSTSLRLFDAINSQGDYHG